MEVFDLSYRLVSLVMYNAILIAKVDFLHMFKRTPCDDGLLSASLPLPKAVSCWTALGVTVWERYSWNYTNNGLIDTHSKL